MNFIMSDSFDSIKCSNVMVDGKPETVLYTFNPGNKRPKVKSLKVDENNMELYVLDNQEWKRVYKGMKGSYGYTSLNNGFYNVSVHV